MALTSRVDRHVQVSHALDAAGENHAGRGDPVVLGCLADLRVVQQLLQLADARLLAALPCEPAEQLLRRRLADLDTELARLTALRAEMASMIQRLPSTDCLPPSPGTWCPHDEGK